MKRRFVWLIVGGYGPAIPVLGHHPDRAVLGRGTHRHRGAPHWPLQGSSHRQLCVRYSVGLDPLVDGRLAASSGRLDRLFPPSVASGKRGWHQEVRHIYQPNTNSMTYNTFWKRRFRVSSDAEIGEVGRMTGTIKLADTILERLAKGDGILFLGAGASRAATSPDGRKGLSGNDLKDLLCDKFLAGNKKDKSLAYVGDLVKSEVGILDMQRYVCGLFRGLTPTPAHLIVPKLKWKAIFTTNYDLLVEKAYDGKADRVQNLARIICDDDDFQAVLKDPKGLPFLKLHGCVTRDSDTHLPLILSSWEYHKFRERRTRLFAFLKEWGHDFPVVFCGYEIADENVRDILFELADF